MIEGLPVRCETSPVNPPGPWTATTLGSSPDTSTISIAPVFTTWKANSRSPTSIRISPSSCRCSGAWEHSASSAIWPSSSVGKASWFRSCATMVRSPSQRELVHVTPAPALAGLQRAHDGVAGRVEVRGGVLARRRVAAPDAPALEADAQVHPGPADREAVGAALRRRGDPVDVVEVAAPRVGVRGELDRRRGVDPRGLHGTSL